MPSLHDLQNGFATALRLGPDALPPTMLSGDTERALLAMAAYANTISHGRLVALEDIFPTCRAVMGDAAFNHICRSYIEAGCGIDGPLAHIGDRFPAWLVAHDADTGAVDAAHFDLACLAAYHSADCPAMTLSDLPSDEAGLMALTLMQHPAASMHPACPALVQHCDIATGADTAALLLTRPALSVHCHPASDAMAVLWPLLRQPVTFADLCANHVAEGDDATLVPAIIALIDIGALQRGE